MNDDTLEAGELAAQVTRDGDTVTLAFHGNADGRVDQELEAFLGRVHASILKTPAATAIADIRALEFMNSSCFKGFITWIVQVRRMDPATRYNIQFVSTTKYPWQKRSLHAISYFGGDLITIVVDD
ncbi:MAG: hypothetical protein R3A79_31385 [Nannocystaceae bacterium]